MKTLLIEIGAEEIPAGYIVPALTAFQEKMLNALKKARVDHGDARVYGTPRRLALMVQQLSDMQRPETSTLTGPPESIGFDSNGKPTLAAQKFAEKAGISVDQITVTDSGKGRYLTAVVEEECKATAEILEEILPGLILSIPFPKTMRWADLNISFARPIISIAALLGDKVLNFRLGNLTSDRKVFGHFFMSNKPFDIETAEDYPEVLRQAGVIADIEERKQLLKEAIEAKAHDYNATILKDDELIDIVTNLVEYPYPVVGRFDDEFLEVPDEVLITAMREHQKYFALTDAEGRLKPYFIAVNNTAAKDMDLVAKGHGRVIRARLADAKFFYTVDLESSLDQFAEKLKKVTYQADLGTVYEKRERLVGLCRYLADTVETSDRETLSTDLVRAAQLCKADLVSQMVIEFTKLQGVIGRVYALKSGETSSVAHAIEQHYRPVYSGGSLPEDMTGKLLAIADKIDTICGCFFINLIPTGASDPYALRRQAIGILQIILDASLDLSLTDLVDKAISQYVTEESKKAAIAADVLDFFQRRMSNMLAEQGISKEAVHSALAASFNRVTDDLLRIKALETLRQAPDFEPLSAAFKRVVNIMKKQEMDVHQSVDESLFENDAEQTLYRSCRDVGLHVKELNARGDYETALKEIATLRTDVDRFFDDVMVMVEDEAIRNNRIALLSSVSGLFSTIADFSQI